MNLSQLSLSGIDINIGRSVGVGVFVGEGKVGQRMMARFESAVWRLNI